MATRWVPAGVLAALVTLGAAAQADATKYAGPFGSGTGTTCAAVAPCTLPQAVAAAGSGEEVVVNQGDYRLAAPQRPNGCSHPLDPLAPTGAALAIGDRYVHGVPGRLRPRIIGNTATCVVLAVGSGGHAEGLDVLGYDSSDPEAAAVTIDDGGTATGLETYGADGVVYLNGSGTLRDSVVGQRVQDERAVVQHSGTGRIVHVTAHGDVVADSTSQWSGDDAAEIDCVDSATTARFIALQTSMSPGSSARVDRDHCAGGWNTFGPATATSPDLGGSIASVTLADYEHQTSDSPTVDAGREDPATDGVPDFDGGARTAGAQPDIGADEYGSGLPRVDSGVAVAGQYGPTVVVLGTIYPGGAATDAYAEYGPTTAYGSQTPAMHLDSPWGVPATFTLTGLTGNVPEYHYRLVATNGDALGEDRVISIPDADGDGYHANVDCDDTNAAFHADCPAPVVTPGPTPTPPPTAVNGGSGHVSYPALGSAVGFRLARHPRYSVFTDLFVRHAAKGATVTVTCSGPGCPFKAKREAVERSTAKLSLRALLRRAKLRPGARVGVSVTRAGAIGVQTTLTVRAGRARPARRDLCLVPGAERASRCAA